MSDTAAALRERMRLQEPLIVSLGTLTEFNDAGDVAA